MIPKLALIASVVSTSVFAQKAGSFEEVGNTRVSAMMVSTECSMSMEPPNDVSSRRCSSVTRRKCTSWTRSRGIKRQLMDTPYVIAPYATFQWLKFLRHGHLCGILPPKKPTSWIFAGVYCVHGTHVNTTNRSLVILSVPRVHTCLMHRQLFCINL